MALLLINQISSQLSYVNGQITVPANSSIILPIGLAPYIGLDGKFLNDIQQNPPNVLISDGVNTYSGQSALNFIGTWLNNGPPQNSTDPVAFTLAGLGFSITADVSLSNTTETPLILFSNPSGNTVNGRALNIYVSTDSTQGILTTRVYSSPTASSNGTNISSLILNDFLGGPNNASTSMQIYSSPTITSNGNKRISLVTSALTSPPIFNFNQTAIIAPGNSLLITGQAANLGLLASLSCHFYLQWVEV